jgi:hypothetical protein
MKHYTLSYFRHHLLPIINFSDRLQILNKIPENDVNDYREP